MPNKKSLILDAYQARHACKEFNSDKKISDADFEFLLQIISLSPSSFGLQPYEVFVLKEAKLLQELHPHMWGAQKQLPTASHVLMFATKKDITVHDAYFEHILLDVQQTPVEMQEFRRNLINDYQLNEIQIKNDSRYLDDWAAKQAYIALANVMSAAAQIGIDSCPIEGFVRNNVREVLVKHKLLDPQSYEIAVFCCLGYRLTDQVRAKTRKPIIELVHA
ncbi:MAG: NAD(P)H-dependent oxidoreductase [Burkholderiales bacterium]|jgi:nitroreductase|nr:NAD(P)H-dependent oxidoreductase [Burkholderiales bacterium]